MSLIKPCKFHWDSKFWPNLHKIDPYRGCTYACNYCWSKALAARFGKKADWANVEVAPGFRMGELVKFEKPITLLIGATSDPIPPCEEKERKTWQILQRIANFKKYANIKNKYTYLILTKNPAIVEYSPILKEIGVWAGMSITASPRFYQDVQAKFEPHAPSNEWRIDALQKLHEAGIKTFASIEPWLVESTGEGFAGYTNPDSIVYLHPSFI